MLMQYKIQLRISILFVTMTLYWTELSLEYRQGVEKISKPGYVWIFCIYTWVWFGITTGSFFKDI